MTTPAPAPSRLDRLNTTTTGIKNVLFLFGLISLSFSGLTTATSFLFVKFIWPSVIEQLRSELNVATKDDVVHIQKQIRQITGDDRIFKMIEGATYVLEPVSQGEPIEMILGIQRTEYGIECVFIEGTPLFRDSRDIPFPGRQFPPIKQVGLEMDRLPLTLYAPDALQSGRIGLTLSMHYRCPFGKDGTAVDIYDETKMVWFQLDPAPK
jgi:hypothetical protein